LGILLTEGAFEGAVNSTVDRAVDRVVDGREIDRTVGWDGELGW
jgi:hypothetical protein